MTNSILAFLLVAGATVAAAHPEPQGNVIWYTSAGPIQAVDERSLPDSCRIDSMLVLSTGYVFVVPGGIDADVAKSRRFDLPTPTQATGWSIWSDAILRK